MSLDKGRIVTSQYFSLLSHTVLHYVVGYGAWSTGNMSEKMVEEYLEHHQNSSNKGGEDFMLE
jgi:hypothetical protein